MSLKPKFDPKWKDLDPLTQAALSMEAVLAELTKSFSASAAQTLTLGDRFSWLEMTCARRCTGTLNWVAPDGQACLSLPSGEEVIVPADKLDPGGSADFDDPRFADGLANGCLPKEN